MSDGLSSGPMSLGEKPLGQSRGGLLADRFNFNQVPAWFDVRVFYVRVASCPLDDTPDVLTMRYPPRDISTALEVNGGRIAPSEELKLTLRRDRVDTESSEATYVTTDNFRASGAICFEVYDKEQVLLTGNFDRSDRSTDAQESDVDRSAKTGWKMDLTCAVTSPACAFFKGRHEFSTAALSAPTMEVCVVGRYGGSPVMLTEIVQLTVRRRSRKNTLDAIVEGDEGENGPRDLLLAGEQALVPAERERYPDMTDKTLATLGTFYGSDGNMNGYIEGDDGELSWFNAGVRVGVGIGLGMCLGVGIGVGLMVRTYQATTRTFRRNLF